MVLTTARDCKVLALFFVSSAQPPRNFMHMGDRNFFFTSYWSLSQLYLITPKVMNKGYDGIYMHSYVNKNLRLGCDFAVIKSLPCMCVR